MYDLTYYHAVSLCFSFVYFIIRSLYNVAALTLLPAALTVSLPLQNVFLFRDIFSDTFSLQRHILFRDISSETLSLQSQQERHWSNVCRDGSIT
jgi:hypothetical protein